MVHWPAEEKAIINSVWGKVNAEKDGGEVLSRLLIVYPWTQRYFSSFGNLNNAAAIQGNAKVHAHGKKVLEAIGHSIEHIDDIKHYLHDLSKSHAQELHVDPENFKRLLAILVTVLSNKLGASFTPKVQAVFEKFNAVLVSALSHEYHH
ncbi:hemoglobin subunit beta-2-like [Mixophyes fleayi]|uniref:hemoglobin subunit beta-2-like n=1 Tax=Mixophyes fleayi TaxID=3061075 RepID=UPI003F4D9DCF